MKCLGIPFPSERARSGLFSKLLVEVPKGHGSSKTEGFPQDTRMEARA
jgi:hypothetical protein